MESTGLSAPTAETDTAEFQWLRTGEEALNAMLAAIDEARSSVRLETYIFHAGPLAEQFRDGLLQARGRGVKVHLLIDALGSISLSTAF